MALPHSAVAVKATATSLSALPLVRPIHAAATSRPLAQATFFRRASISPAPLAVVSPPPLAPCTSSPCRSNPFQQTSARLLSSSRSLFTASGFPALQRRSTAAAKLLSYQKALPSVAAAPMASAAASDALPELVDGGGPYDWDLLTIGIGSGGTRASRIASSLGAKVAAVELAFNPISSETTGGVGGTCVLRGCVPKKILVYGSSFKSEFEDAAGFGWDLHGPPSFNWKKLLAEKTREIERLNGVYKRILNNAGVTLFEGRGRIVDEHTVEILKADGTTERLTAKYILVAVGGRPTVLDIPGKEYVITSDEALSLEEFPKSIAIVGGGYIAVEFAGIFNGFGAKVDLVYRQHLPLRGFDGEMRNVVASNLQERGITIHPGNSPTKIEKTADGQYTLHTDKGEAITADYIMFATGRAPNTKNLGLEKVGVEMDSHGAIKVSEYSQTNVKSIWAIGDVTNRLNLTPVALMEGTAFARTVFGNEPTKPDFTNVASAVFCQPPLAVVGMSEEQAVQSSANDILVFTSTFNPMKNTVSGRQEKTYMKLIVDAVTDKILGAAMVGPDSAEIMQGLGITLKCGVTKKIFDSTVGIHPTAAEEFVTMRTPTRRVPGMLNQEASAASQPVNA